METTRLIEAYLDKTLTPEEQKVFEEKTAADPSFLDLVRLHQEINESIGDKDFESLHNLIEKVSREYQGEKIVRRPFMQRIIQIAAICLILFALSAVLKLTVFSATKSEKLFRQYYETYSIDGTTRSAGTEISVFNSAINEYSKKNFPEALRQFNSIVEKQPDNYNAQYFRGLTYLEMKDIPNAISSFKMIPLNWNNLLSEHRDWYLALALLKQGNSGEADIMFRKIRDGHGFYSDKAGEIVNKTGN